jgi:predicted TIM-barrel fold metal-dependent hydrolase
MDAYGIDVTVLSSHAAISADVVRGNDETLRALDAFPDRLLGYCVINPNYPEVALREIERCFAHPGIRGFKFHPELHGDYPLTGKGYAAAWEFAHERSLPVLSHSYFAGDGLDSFASLARRYPRATVILGHAGIDHGIDAVQGLVLDHPNVVLDLCGALSHAGVLEQLVERVGADRLLFGTDMPFMSGARQLGTILYSRLSDAQRRAILGGTAARLFRVGTLEEVA